MRDPLTDPIVGDTCAPAAECYHVLSVDDRTVMVQSGGSQYWIPRREWVALMRGGVVVARAKEAEEPCRVEQSYPCRVCGVMLATTDGVQLFTECDECWGREKADEEQS